MTFVFHQLKFSSFLISNHSQNLFFFQRVSILKITKIYYSYTVEQIFINNPFLEKIQRLINIPTTF